MRKHERQLALCFIDWLQFQKIHPDRYKLHLMDIQKTRLFRLGILLATLILVIGLITPMLTMRKFYFFDNSFSVLGGVTQLFKEGEWVLGLIVAMFSIVLPLVKLIFLYLLM